MEKIIICGIYKIISPSNKIYIGQALDIYKRWSKYKSLNCNGQPHLYNSLKKHGYENHKFEILFECSEDELNEQENYFINKFDSFNSKHGMNLRNGGGRNSKLSDESKKKSGEKQKINWVKRRLTGTDKQSEETIQKRIASYKETLKKKKEMGIVSEYSEERKTNIGVMAKEYQRKLKLNPEYYSEEQTQKRKYIARRGYLTQIRNGTTRKNKKRIPLFGEDNYFFGKKHTKETLDKIQKSRKPTWEKKIADGWKQSSEHVAKRVQKQLGKKRTKEHIENMKAILRARRESGYYEKNKEKLSEIQKKAWQKRKENGFYSDEEKSKRSAIAYKRWENTGKNKK